MRPASSPLPLSRELYVCQRPSESIGSEQTTTISSNNGVEHQNNACMKGFAPSPFLVFHQQNGHKKRVWRNGAWVELLTPSILTALLASSGPPKSSERIITAPFRLPCVN